jgi:hypothetical protein
MQELGKMSVTGSEEEPGAAITAGFDGRSRGFVGWGGPKRQSPVSVASLAPGATRFSKAVTVDAGVRKNGAYWFYQGASLAPLDAGGAVFAWTSPSGDVRAATFDARGDLARTQRLPGTMDATVVGGSGEVAIITSNSKKDVPQRLWRLTAGRLKDVAALPPVTVKDHYPTFDFDPAGRFRLTNYGVGAGGGPELRAMLWAD